MTGAVPFKTAWQDPEHVRLASYRSPDDGTKVALRGPVPPFLDPWLTGSGEAPDPLVQAAERGFTRSDDYAAHRCRCRHLIYGGQVPGGSCQFCPCSEHVAQGAPQ